MSVPRSGSSLFPLYLLAMLGTVGLCLIVARPVAGLTDPGLHDPSMEGTHPPLLLSGGSQLPGRFQEWQILEGKTGREIPFEQWIAELATRDVIYLGEEHRNRAHIEAALKVLRALLTANLRPVLALEMFGWDGQAGLDRYLRDPEAGRDQFLLDSHWEQNWGGRFDDYEPLIAFSRQQSLPVLALNPPRRLVRGVAFQGLEQALADPDMVRWGMRDETFLDEPSYRAVILDQLRKCHGGLSEAGYQHMYEASVFRDEGMAKTIADFLGTKAPEQGPLVSYTGGGHIQYRIPVPDRVRRRHAGSVKQATVYLTAFEPPRMEEIAGLIKEPIADYLWLTPLGAHGSPKRCL